MAIADSRAAKWLEQVYPRNRAALLGEMGLFIGGFAFADPSTILGSFVVQLTSSPVLLGLVLVVYNMGLALPQIAAAGLVRPFAHKRPAWIAVSIVRTLPYVALALAAFTLAGHPGALLAIFFVALGLYAIGSGVEFLLWVDLVGKIIPPARRGAVLGIGRVIGGLLAMGGGLLARQILERLPFPANYGLMFALFAILAFLSIASFSLVVEPAGTPPGGRLSPWGAYAQAWRLWEVDSRFRRLLLARVLFLALYLALPFYVAFGRDVVGLPAASTGLYVTMAMLGQVVGSSLWAWVSGRLGNRWVVILSALVAALVPGAAALFYVLPGSFFVLLYVMVGMAVAGEALGFVNYLLDLAPADDRLTYISLLNTVGLPFLLAPLLGGLLLERLSYPGLFALATLLMLLAVALATSLPGLGAHERRAGGRLDPEDAQ